jgi:nicotinate phosphoribosyltransferase
VTGSGAATAGLVYKMVARENGAGNLVDVAKQSKDKATVGGRKWAQRRLDARGHAEAEIIGTGQMPRPDSTLRPLLVELIQDGEIVADLSLEAARSRYQQSLAELPPRALQLSRGEPVIPTVYEDERH